MAPAESAEHAAGYLHRRDSDTAKGPQPAWSVNENVRVPQSLKDVGASLSRPLAPFLDSCPSSTVKDDGARRDGDMLPREGRTPADIDVLGATVVAFVKSAQLEKGRPSEADVASVQFSDWAHPSLNVVGQCQFI